MTIYIAYKSGVFRSDDLGESWEPLLKGLEDMKIHAIAAFQDTFFAGTNKGLYQLNNVEWEPVLIDQENLQGETLNISTLVVADNNLYAAALKVEENPAHGIDIETELLKMGIELPPFTFHPSSWLLYRFSGRDDSWTDITPKHELENKKEHFIRDYSTSLYRTFIVESPSIQLAASGENVLMVAGHSHFYSSDSGQTWTHLDNVSDINNVSGAVLLNDNTFYRSGMSGIHRTINRGISWQKLKYWTDQYLYSSVDKH